MKAPILVSIPHGGRRIAPEIRDIWALSESDALHDGDPFTDLIYDFGDHVQAQLVMEYYRAVVDLNRAPDDIAPQNPDGVVKSHTCWDVPVYRAGALPDDELKRVLLDRYYYPYHERIEHYMNDSRIRLVVDCHSMAAASPPIEEDAGTVRPLICLGNLGDEDGEVEPVFERVTCDPGIMKFMAEEFEIVFRHEDLEVEPPAVVTMNVPFNGGYITRTHGGRGIPLVQIEMSRALYLNKWSFDENALELDESRIRDLNRKIWTVLEKTVSCLS